MANDTLTVRSDDTTLKIDSFNELERMAKMLAAAGGGFIPSHLKNAGQVAAVVLAGKELGIGPMAAMRGLFLIEGKVGMDQGLVLALVHRAGVKTKWTRADAEGATLVFMRGVEEHEETFTMEDARRAGLAGKGVWKSYPKSMLKARCVTAGARAFCPEVFYGAVYTPEELDHETVTPSEPRRPTTLAQVIVDAQGESSAAQTPAGERTAGAASDGPAPRESQGAPAGEDRGVVQGEKGVDHFVMRGLDECTDDVTLGEWLTEHKPSIKAMGGKPKRDAWAALVAACERIGVSADFAASRLA